MQNILSLNHLFAERAREHPDLEVFCIPDANFCYKKYTTAGLDAAASLLANHLKDADVLPGRVKGDATSRLTVGLLGLGNVDYVITEMALFRMGYCVLFLSPNNSPPATAHLLTVTNVSHVIVQETLLSSATKALAHLADSSSVSIIHLPSPEVFRPDPRALHLDKVHWIPPLSPESEHLLPVMILHSSGSTEFPKPIAITNKAILSRYKLGFGPTGFFSLTTFPLYHVYGQSNMIRAWYAVKPLYFFPTMSIPLSSVNIVKVISQISEVETIYAPPFTLKLLAETSDGLQALKRLKVVMFGGGACPQELGDHLVSEGVCLVTNYGLTETGQLMSSLRDFGNNKEWSWMRTKGPHIPCDMHKYLRFESHGGDMYELHVLDGWPTKVSSNQPDGSFATKDLFIKHPTTPDTYKYIGRVDDTLVMVNGEKTNPLPIEHALYSSPYIADAVVFGAGRTQIGALILPSVVAQHFSSEEFAEHLASVVALANADAPTHSQLSTEAFIFLPFGTVIPKTDKGSVMRAKTYKKFEDVIDGLYKRLEGSTGLEGKRRVGNEAEARAIVREVIGRIIGRPIDGLEDDTDLFEFGLNSLQSTRIRNAIQRNVDLGGKTLSIGAVSEHPSINNLAKLIALLSSGKDFNYFPASSQEFMLELVEKYSHFTYLSQANTDGMKDTGASAIGKVVVLTGATGSLGAFILYELLMDPDVETVYCLCRAENDSHAAERLATSMKTRKLLNDANTSERVVALAADLPAVRLGLDVERYDEIANRVTVLIHNAWAVNFNLGISSFEPHIRGAVNLMHLALSSPRSQFVKFFFASSISAVLSWPGPALVPEAVTDTPALAQGTGYAQSKWVTEKLCQIAARKTPMHTAILRIGQIVGDATNGIWNQSEGVPLIIKSADTIGVLPELDGEVTWLPVDYAARSIVELANLPIQTTDCPVYHIQHPTRVPWSFILTALQAAHLDFKPVPPRDWLKALQASDPDEQRNPSRKLLGFYEGMYGGEDGKTRIGLCMENTMRLSQWLRGAPMVNEVLVRKWIGAWRQSGFLRNV